ncbi:MAG: hypothetical protein ACYTEQ_03490 [Planctomycetota bacterium]|jgi:hypothetical protein
MPKRMKCQNCGKVRKCKRLIFYHDIDDLEEGKNGYYLHVCAECEEETAR